ncbi:MAG: GntR family transcriptional regulator [Candidatus Hydrogenedentes bacterium]|nr:GntR family transcriptional regulator [Candidatus Hydrogenedentota bacterium]
MLHITINQGDGLPLYLQLVQQFKHLIATGRLKADTELPSVRALSEQLLVNPNTVVRAYRELEVAGLVYKKRGSGTFVSASGSPYTGEECRRILSQRADTLIVEGRNLGFGVDQLVDLLRERDRALNGKESRIEGSTSKKGKGDEVQND